MTKTLLFLLLTTALGQAQQKPNIIFILADDLGYGDLGVLWQNEKKGKKHKTPFLDQMAAEGMILDRHYCPAPVCAPSRGSLLTGMHQGHANIRDNQFDKELENNHNLANTLKTVGYATSIIGKWGLQGNGEDPESWPSYPTKRGFDTFYGYVRHVDGHVHYPKLAWELGDSKSHTTPKELYDQDQEISEDLDKCFTPDLFTARAKKLIADEVHDGDEQPFFLFLSYDTPHAALQLPTVEYPGENNEDDGDTSGLGLEGGVQYLGNPGKMINTATGTEDSYRHPDYTGRKWSDVEERFATLVRRLDDNVGDLRKTLEDLGIAANTLIVFTSDNGPHNESYLANKNYSPQSFQSYGPFEGQKRDCWEGGIREPSLVCWPGKIPAGSKTTQHSQFHDWLPTFCEIAGLPAPARTDGVSLVPTLLDPGNAEQKTPTTYVEYSTGGRTPDWNDFANQGGTSRKQAQVIYLDGYKGIRNNPKNAETDFEIYDTLTDLSESENLFASPPAGQEDDFQELQQRMKDRVLQIRRPVAHAPRPWDDAPVPSAKLAEKPRPGVRYRVYSGDWPWIPEFTDLKEERKGTFATGIDLGILPEGKPDAGLLLTGFLKIPTTGNWTFTTKTDSGSFLRIHDIMVVDDDFHHDGSAKSGAVHLEKGFHPFRLYYKNSPGAKPGLDFHWTGPDTGQQAIPRSAFFR